jgi:hypothetical protein
MKNFFLALVALVLLVTSCKNSSQSPFVKKVGNYSVVTIEAPDLSGISDNGKEVLNLYRFAADEVDAIYWEQYFGDKQSLLGGLKDSMQKVYAEINYGPWDRLDGKSFVEGYADRTPGVEYYPSDMTAEEFEQFDNPDKMSPYTLIRRGENGTLETVWYHDAYKAHVEKIANYLKAAADITIKPSVKKYLLSKADALLTDNYYDSDIAWLDMVDSKMDLVIGPNETVDDQLMGLKRSYEAYVLLKNEEKTKELMQYVSRLDEFQKDLPCDEEYKNFQPGSGSNIFSCDALYYAGKANAGIKVIALNLPFDAQVQKDKGTRTILLENVIRAKYNNIIHPAGAVLLDEDSKEHMSPEAFLWNIAFREVSHGLGVKETVNGKGSVDEALGSSAMTFEEIKANAAGVWLVCKLQEKFDLKHIFTKRDALTIFFVSLIRSERFGEGSALGRANTIIYNYLSENGAFTRKPNGQYTLDLAKMETLLGELTGIVLKTQATGDKEFAQNFEAKYAHHSEAYKSDETNLDLADVPIDIRFDFQTRKSSK